MLTGLIRQCFIFYFNRQKNIISRFGFLIILSFSVFSNVISQPGLHDPSRMIKNTDGRFWIFFTGRNIGAVSSADSLFNDWRYENAVFQGGYPSWVHNYTIDFGGVFWAPDIIFMNGYYYLYYSASSWGTTNSAIGVARATRLGTQWEDLGMVVSSGGSSSERNAIDPGLFKDNDGRVWMSYGSFFAGIGLVEIDTVTGKTKGDIVGIAGGNHMDIEASYITGNGDYYYLFVNRGACCNGLESTYYIEVSRSTTVTGPYSEWHLFLSHEGRFHGPGHVGVGEGVLTYHFYDTEDNGASRLSINSISYVNGWPVAGTPKNWSFERSEVSEGYYRIIARHSNKAVKIFNNTPSEGQDIVQGEIESERSQIWTFTETINHLYKISPYEESALCFDVYGISNDDGANINLWTYWGGSGQQFYFRSIDSAWYQIIANNSDKCLEVSNASLAENASIIQMTCDTAKDNQLFKLESTRFYLVSVKVKGNGSVNKSTGFYLKGEEINLVAVPDNGWKFDGWTGDTIAADSSITFTVANSYSITANFSEIGTTIIESSSSLSAGNLRFYPNPAKDFISVDLPDAGASITITDNLGRVVMNFPSLKGPNDRLDISALNRGLYIVRIHWSGYRGSAILFKQ